jgi:hypothetical protein
MKVVRNAFAHAVHQISFSTKSIRQKCLSIGQNEPGFDPYFSMTVNGTMLNLNRPRDRYIYASLVYSMLMRAHTVRGLAKRPKRIHKGLFSAFY